jgi:hypothetical protein
MAVITLSDLIQDIRGKVGGKIYSIWKGIHTVKSQPINFRYAWESSFNVAQRALIKTCAYRWAYVLTSDQKAGWETYANYLATLPTDYDRLVGWKQYGGAMSGFNAYTHCNQLRLSVGLATVQDDAPIGEVSPGQPVFNTLTYNPGPPISLTAAYTLPDILPSSSYLRVWAKGTKYAHLILAGYKNVTGGPGVIWTVAYEGNEKPPDATPHWILEGTDEAEILDGILHLTQPVEQTCDYYRTIPYPQAGLCVRFRAKTLNATSNQCQMRIFLQATAGTGWPVFLILAENAVLYYVNNNVVHTESIDVTTYHEYEIRFDGTNWFLLIDSVPVHEEVAPEPIPTDVSTITFGHVAPYAYVQSWWDYVRYYLGASEPPSAYMLTWDKMRYARGAELNIFPDTYQCQLDIVSDKGRFGPPSNIKTLRVT